LRRRQQQGRPDTSHGTPSVSPAVPPHATHFSDSLRGHRERPLDPLSTKIGASILVEPFFLPKEMWIPPPADWSSNLTRGKTCDTEIGEGQRLWQRVLDALAVVRPAQPIADIALRGDIWEVRADGNRVIHRVLFAQEGRRSFVLLALVGFTKKTQLTPPDVILLAEQRLADWRSRGQ
jgi:Phage derived protein Gp49-like (DUF891)